MPTCPRCGARREGGRYCPNCAFDYWADAAATTCPRCQTRRSGFLPICPSCGYDYRPQQSPATQLPPITPRLDASPSSSRPHESAAVRSAPGLSIDTLSVLAGCAWLAAGVFSAYLALLQLGVSGYYAGQNMQLLALSNGVGAAAWFYLGARLMSGATKGLLGWSAALSVLAVAVQGYQIAGGATHWSFLATTVAALAAGVLSLVAWPEARASRP